MEVILKTLSNKVVTIFNLRQDWFLAVAITLICVPISATHHSMKVEKVMCLTDRANNILKLPHPHKCLLPHLSVKAGVFVFHLLW